MASYGVVNIPSIVTDAFNEAVGKNNSVTKIDSTNFVDCGHKIDDFDLLDGWYGSLVKRIIKVLFFSKYYNADTRRILRDESTFGGFIEKLYTIAPDAVDNPVWKNAPDATTRKITQLSPYALEDILQVKSVIFGKEGTWSYEFVMPIEQLRKAWKSPAEMAGFIDSQFIPVRNKIEGAKEAVIATAINTSIANCLQNGLAVNLLGEYTSATSDATVTDLNSYLLSKDALRYGNRIMAKYKNLIQKLSTKFNAEGYETFTPVDDLVLEVQSDYAQSSAFYLESDTYHKELVELPGYKEVPYWQTPGNGISATPATCTSIFVQNDDIAEDPINQSGIVAFMHDVENVAAYFGNEYEWSQPNVRQRVSNHGFQYSKGYAVDKFANSIVFYVAPAGTITPDTTDAHISAITASPNYTEPGKDIAFTVTAGSGYHAKKVTVTANSKTVDITDTVDDDGKYHYIPNDTSNITVKATSEADS